MNEYTTQGGITVEVTTEKLAYEQAIEPLIQKLDQCRGAIFSSSFEYPGRYTRWDVGFVNPPLVIEVKGLMLTITALNQRGEVLLAMIAPTLQQCEEVNDLKINKKNITGEIELSQERVAEELRSKQPSVFSILRSLIDLFKHEDECYLGLYGAFAYDLVFQFEQLVKKLERQSDQRDLVLYLPDELYIVDHRREIALRKQYDFILAEKSTQAMPRDGEMNSYRAIEKPKTNSDHAVGEYAKLVEVAKKKFKVGDLFEVVPSQTFHEHCSEQPSVIFQRLCTQNPSPYGFMINLGDDEYIVGASPEMYVRVNGNIVETCPIAGTIKRGEDALHDAKNIKSLLNSVKEESELTMCADVDRNDKSRICKPGSVEVVGRRQIEMYSRLIHTVDHVKGELAEKYDALDAFLSHMWVVTVTGAPKLWAMQFIEDHEKSPRRWYGGSVGWLGFDGNINTGLTLRTIRLKQGMAEVRVGATLLYDSDPVAEEQETQLKASALLAAIRNEKPITAKQSAHAMAQSGQGKKILLVDHQDSFVHTLANYFRQTGAELETYRFGFSEDDLVAVKPDLIVLSPGPGQPKDFNTAALIDWALKHKLPIFGVCLGLQAIVEYFGGELAELDYPMHGKPSAVMNVGGQLFADLPKQFSIGRYHSLYAVKEKLPKELTVTATTEDGVIMAIEHQSLPITAVQFHPESILSLEDNVGAKIIANVMKTIA